MSHPASPNPHGERPIPAAGDHRALRLLAEHIETTFNGKHLTLTDDDTAAAYRLTLLIVAGILDGAQAQGIVDEVQRHELGELIGGMTTAPDLV